MNNAAIDIRESMANMSNTSSMLIVEPVGPKGGNLVKEKNFDPQPLLSRMSILNTSYDEFERAINATDTSRITNEEMQALNDIKMAYQNAKDTFLSLLK